MENTGDTSLMSLYENKVSLFYIKITGTRCKVEMVPNIIILKWFCLWCYLFYFILFNASNSASANNRMDINMSLRKH